MKVIELLNKIANGEEVPKSINFLGEQYFFEENNYTRLDEKNCNRWLFDDLYEVINILNCEVEILEE